MIEAGREATLYWVVCCRAGGEIRRFNLKERRPPVSPPFSLACIVCSKEMGAGVGGRDNGMSWGR